MKCEIKKTFSDGFFFVVVVIWPFNDVENFYII